jgi:hypothetical protein
VIRLVATVLAALALTTPARAEPIELADGKYASAEDYVVGTWVWQRDEPRESRKLTFERGGGFVYVNAQSHVASGRYEVRGRILHLVVNRWCETPDTCRTSDDPSAVDQPFKPVSADVFMSNSERWQRQK